MPLILFTCITCCDIGLGKVDGDTNHAILMAEQDISVTKARPFTKTTKDGMMTPRECVINIVIQ